MLNTFTLIGFLDKLKGQRRVNGLPHDQRQNERCADMKDLPSIELLRKLLRYEPETGKLFWLERPRDMFPSKRGHSVWNARYANKEAFTCVNAYGYLHGRIARSAYYAHRIAWALFYGEQPSGEVDHINGDKADNRLENLRDVSRSVNQRNVPLKASNKSGHNGVIWHSASSKWMARITINQVVKYLGVYENIEDAIAARVAAQSGLGFTDRHGNNEAQRNGATVRGVIG
jgi:hypothetical protein